MGGSPVQERQADEDGCRTHRLSSLHDHDDDQNDHQDDQQLLDTHDGGITPPVLPTLTPRST
jgi:hypothetical protein